MSLSDLLSGPRDLAALVLLYRIAFVVGPRLIAWHAYQSELLEALARAGNVPLPASRPAFLPSESPMLKRMIAPVLFLLAAALAALPLAGCSAVRLSAPATMVDVDALRAHVDEADAAIRADAAATRSAGEAAYMKATAEGKSVGDALAAKWAAESDGARAAARAAELEAAEAKRKAEEARATAGGGASILEAGIASVVAALLAALGLNTSRNASRRRALAAVAAGKPAPAS